MIEIASRIIDPWQGKDFETLRRQEDDLARIALSRLIGQTIRVASVTLGRDVVISGDDGQKHRFFLAKNPDDISRLIGQEIAGVEITEDAQILETVAGERFFFFGWINPESLGDPSQ